MANAYRVVSDLAAIGAENNLHVTKFMDGVGLPTHIADMHMK